MSGVSDLKMSKQWQLFFCVTAPNTSPFCSFHHILANICVVWRRFRTLDCLSLSIETLLSTMKTFVEAFVAVLFVVMWGHVQVDAFVLLPQATIQLTRRRTSAVSKSISMSTPVREEGNLLKFGSRIPSKRNTTLVLFPSILPSHYCPLLFYQMSVNVALPTKDIDKAKAFLSKTEYIVESTWMKGKQTNMGKGVFLLQFLTLPIGLDTITPEIEVEFLYDPIDCCIRMKSGKWQLIGREGVKKDSRFMNSFQIYLEGVLKIVPSPSSSSNGANNDALTNGKEGESQSQSLSKVEVDGWVRYAVEGEKPRIFKRAPQFILDNTISFIQVGSR